MPEETDRDAPDTIDRDALRAKYREERDKRIRPDGNDQYLEPTGRFASLLDDPYVTPVPRAPVHDEVTVAIIGGGFGGPRDRRAPEDGRRRDVRIVEGGGDVGGAWYWNRYPGAMCDTAAMIYLPMLEETGHMPTHEVRARARDLRPRAAHRHAVRALRRRAALDRGHRRSRWDDDASRWVDHAPTAATSSGRGSSRWAPVRCTVPKLPGIPGIETFAGHWFHTSRWDYAYTGGDPASPMTELADRRVGIIGTGATAVQCIPPLGRDAGELFVFQRTPSSIDERNNHADRPRVVRDARARAGSASGSSTSRRSRPAGSPTRTSSRTAGPTSRSASATA